MIDRQVDYLGITLRNPIVVSSCGFTSNVESIKKLENAGVGAVVLKSLFEEQIIGEAINTSTNDHTPEMESYIDAYVKENNISQYIQLLKDAKQQCSIPIIASICCISGGQWIEYAKEIEKAGADALELNIFYISSSVDESSAKIEEIYLSTAEKVVKNISIPVTVKMPNHFTNPLNVVNELYFRGVKGVVMFNRFYEPDIDTDDMKIISASDFYSTAQDICHAIRWIGITSSKIETISYGSSTGVHKREDVVKMLLAGASAVHICSILYDNGFDVIAELLEYIDTWAEKHTFTKVSEFVGLLNSSSGKCGEIYERAQFMKYFSSKE